MEKDINKLKLELLKRSKMNEQEYQLKEMMNELKTEIQYPIDKMIEKVDHHIAANSEQNSYIKK